MALPTNGTARKAKADLCNPVRKAPLPKRTLHQVSLLTRERAGKTAQESPGFAPEGYSSSSRGSVNNATKGELIRRQRVEHKIDPNTVVGGIGAEVCVKFLGFRCGQSASLWWIDGSQKAG